MARKQKKYTKIFKKKKPLVTMHEQGQAVKKLVRETRVKLVDIVQTELFSLI